MNGIEVLEVYHKSTDWFPIISSAEWTKLPKANEYCEKEIGWNAGMLDEKRPFFATCWAVDQITMLTVYVSNKGIEDKTAEEMDQWLQEIGYYKGRDEHRTPEMVSFEDEKGNGFFSINIVVGIEDSDAYIDGGHIFPYRVLFEYNKNRIITSNSGGPQS